MPRVLIVDDEENMRRILTILLEQDGYEVLLAEGVTQALSILESEPLDLVLTDEKMPDGSGTALLKTARDSDLTLPVIILTAYATVELAVEAMRQGAFDFITKPFDPDAVRASVARACQHSKLLQENRLLRSEVARLATDCELLGSSPELEKVRGFISRVAPTAATVLITGETGTGKELVARAIHRRSGRSDNAFVAVNCAALPEELLESQLFGHEKGSFTGAAKASQGLFSAAHEGTLFLDEAGEMSLGLQAKLLRVLVDGEFLRVGSTKPRRVDVRLIVATHRDLRVMVKDGRFRDDLYFRLAVVPLDLPPLRERAEDIPLLVEHFLKAVAAEMKVRRKTISPQALAVLGRYSFPGNVRELRNLIERAYILGGPTQLQAEDFPVASPERPAPDDDPREGNPVRSIVERAPDSMDLRGFLQEIERILVVRALQQSGGSQAVAGRRLGLSRSDMLYRVRKFEIHGSDLSE